MNEDVYVFVYLSIYTQTHRLKERCVIEGATIYPLAQTLSGYRQHSSAGNGTLLHVNYNEVGVSKVWETREHMSCLCPFLPCDTDS